MNDARSLAARRVRDDWQKRVESVQTHRLASGLCVSLLPINDERLSAIEVRLAVGSGDERPGERGLAHFLEHLMFRGSRTYPDGRFDELAEARGIQANAWTWLDTTAYTAILTNDALSTLFALETDRLQHLAITEEVFQTERNVVLNERELTLESDPLALAREHLEARLFGDTEKKGPYAHPTIGLRDELEALCRDDVLRFYRRHYRPPQTHLLVSSGLAAGELFAMIDDHFGDYVGEDATTLPERPDLQQFTLGWQETFSASFSEPRVFIAWPYPSAAEPDALAAHDLLWEVLLHERGGRLMHALEIEAEVVLEQNADAAAHRLQHAMFYEAIPRQGVPAQKVVDKVFEVLAQVAKDGIHAHELQAARLSLMTHYARLSPPWRTLRMLGDAQSDAGSMQNMVQRLDALIEAGPEALQGCAARLAAPSQAAVLIAKPRRSR